MDKNKRGLTKAQSQAAGLTGDAKRKAAAKRRKDEEIQKAAVVAEAKRKAAEERKMKMVDKASLLIGSTKVGVGIGNKLADRSIKTSTEKIRQAMKDKALRQKNAALRQARKEGRITGAVGLNKGGRVMKKPVKRKDGSSKEGEKSNNKTKFEKQAEKVLKESKLLGLKTTYKKDQAKPVNRKDGSPKTGEEIIAYEKETHTKYIEKSPLETGKEMMKAQAERNAKNTYPRRRRGVGKAVKGFGKALP